MRKGIGWFSLWLPWPMNILIWSNRLSCVETWRRRTASHLNFSPNRRDRQRMRQKALVWNSLPMDTKHQKNFVYMMFLETFIKKPSWKQWIILHRKIFINSMRSPRFSREEFHACRNCKAFDDYDDIHTIFMRGIWCLEKLKRILWSRCNRQGFYGRNLMSGEIAEHLMMMMPSTRNSCKELDVSRNYEASDDISSMDTVFLQEVWCREKLRSI